MIKLLRKYIIYNNNLPLSQQIFNELCLILSGISVAVGIQNLLIKLPIWISLMFFICSIIPISFIYINKYFKKVALTRLLLVLLFYGICILAWFFNAGINGSIVLFLFALITYSIGIYNRINIFLIFLNFCIFYFLTDLNKFFPQLRVKYYNSEADRIFDMQFSYIVVGISITWVLYSILKNYNRANEIVMLQNSELEHLNGELLALNKKLTRQNELQFLQLFEEHSSIMTILDIPTGKYINANKAALKFYGYSKEEFLQMTINDIVIEISGEEKLFLKKAIDLTQSIFEHTHRLQNGLLRQVEIQTTPVTLQDKVVLYTIIQDITTRKNAEAELIKSEEKYRKLIEKLGEGIVFVNKNEKFELSNPAAEVIFEIESGKMCGKSLIDFVRGNELEKLNEQSKLRQNGIENTYELTIYTEKNNRKIISLTATPQFDEMNTFLGTFGIFHDITQEKQVEEKLRFLANSATDLIECSNYKTIFEYTGRILQQFIPGVKILFYTIHQEKSKIELSHLTGIPDYIIENAIEILGFNPFSLKFDITTLAKIRYAETSVAGPFAPEEFFSKFIPIDNILLLFRDLHISHVYSAGVQYNDRIYAIFDLLTRNEIDKNNLYFVDVLIKQISIAIHRKYLEQQLVLARDDAEIANRAKSSFLANMSHEIRTPLNSVLGFSEILIKQLSNTENQNYAKIINSSGKTLLELLNNILDLSKIDSQTFQLNFNPVNITVLLDSLLLTYKKQLDEKGLQMIIAKKTNFPTLIYTDEKRLMQIFNELLKNAIKFTNEGFIKIEISHQKINPDLCTLRFTIQDTGIGIKVDYQQSIFNTFNQIDDKTNRKYEGAGLGLTLSSKLAKLMNGTIKLAESSEKGSIFILEFQNVKIETNYEQSEENRRVTHTKSMYDNQLILLVDDFPENRFIIKTILNGCNLRFIEASSGEECLKILEKSKPDLILMDIHLPILSGYETTEIIQKKPEFTNIPIIAVTGADLDKKKNDSTAKFSDYLLKPITEEEILEKINKHFRSYKKKYSSGYKKDDELWNITDKESLRNLYNEMNDKCLPQWDRISQKQSIKDIKEFAQSIVDLSQKYNSNVLSNYGEELNKYLKDFDIVKMRESLNHFPQIRRRLLKLIE